MKKKQILDILEILGYKNSSNLYYIDDINFQNINVSNSQLKSLKYINPVAIYCEECKPFIIFIDGDIPKEVSKKIWNIQIPIAICISNDTVKIYNGNILDVENKKIKLIKTDTTEEFIKNKEFSYWNISSIDFWKKYGEDNSNLKLNNLLLGNIKFLTKKLKDKYKIKFATKLVLRIIFIRFLLDKGVNIDYPGFSTNVEQNKNKFIEIAHKKEELYKLFQHLKNKFNGNLFDIENEINDVALNESVFELISTFISAKQDLNSNQISFFDIYDFDIISISLISAIYEILLGEDKQKKDKAFYTPDYLVKYLLNNININDKESFKVLDPACGSGVFLVETFQKILANYADNDGYIKDDNIINKLLTDNIYGIDINEESIDITIFSLYLVVMEHKNPKTLQNYKFPTLKNCNLIVSDFFDEEKTKNILNREFNLIIGNPPWGSINDKSHQEFCQKRRLPIQNKEISRSFIFKVKEICKEKTTCCLVLPSSLLYNLEKPAKETRRILLEQIKIEKIIEMSPVRKLIFEKAVAPTFCMFFKKDKTEYLKNKIEYISLKPNIFFKLFKCICIEKKDIKFVFQEYLRDNDWAWKTMLYGNYYDINIINHIKNEYSKISDIIKEKDFFVGTGLATNTTGDHKDSTGLIGRKILDASKDIDSFYINDKTNKVFNKKYIHRIPSLNRFEAPYVLIKKGVNTKSFKIKAGYSDNSFLYTNDITTIKGKEIDKNELLNITGLLNSSFYAYLSLMLASSIGIEREQHFLKEILDKPYIYSEELVKLVKKIICLKNQRINNYKVEEYIEKLDEQVLMEFGLKDNEAIDYALNVELPIITNNLSVIEKKADNADMKKYSKYFSDYFERIFKNDKYIKINLYINIKGLLNIFELIIVDEKPDKNMEIYYECDEEKEIFSRLIVEKVDNIMKAKDIIKFEKNSFYIIKTNEFKNWHPIMAKMDLSEVINSIYLDNEEDA